VITEKQPYMLTPGLHESVNPICHASILEWEKAKSTDPSSRIEGFGSSSFHSNSLGLSDHFPVSAWN